MTPKERELLIGVARACHINFGSLVSEIEAEAQPLTPAPDPQAPPTEPTPEGMERARELLARMDKLTTRRRTERPVLRDLASALASERQRTAERCAEIVQRELHAAQCSPAGLDHNAAAVAEESLAAIRREFSPATAKGVTEHGRPVTPPIIPSGNCFPAPFNFTKKDGK